MKKSGLIKGAIILTCANIITRTLGFLYRIYMSNVIGAEGMGLYQLIVPIYMLAWSISSSGFSTTISRLTAKEFAKGEYGNAGRILKQSLIISILISIVLAIFLFLYGDFVATVFVNDERTAIPLKILSVCFPFMAAGSCIRGYFYGIQKSLIPAISQVMEQTIRMLTIYFLSSFFISKGIVYACSAAILGVCLGEVISFIYTIIAYIKFKRDNNLTKKPIINPIKAYSVILAMAVPLTLNRMTGSLLSTIENILIPQRLILNGLSHSEAMSTYGELLGMAMPLILFPSAFLVALSITLVPDVTESITLKNTIRINRTISKSLLFTSIIGIGATCLFIVFPYEICYIIYSKREIGNMLISLASICPFVYLSTILSGILNGLGHQVFIFRNSIISSIITIFFVYFMIPFYGIKAFIFGWLLSLIIVNLLSIIKIYNEIDIKLEFKNLLLKPISGAAISAIAAFYLKSNFLNAANTWQGLLCLIVIMYMIYFVYLILTKCIMTEDLRSIKKEITKKSN